jgi:hypothetical protein
VPRHEAHFQSAGGQSQTPRGSSVRLGMPEPARRLGRESAPLGRHGGASRLVRVAIDEMAPLIEKIVDLGVNGAEFM